MVLFGLSGCDEVSLQDSRKNTAQPASGPLNLSQASWDAYNLELSLSGEINNTPAGTSTTQIDITDADTSEILASLPLASGQHGFSAFLDELTSVPCAVAVTVGTLRSTIPVSNAPAGCRQFVTLDALTLNVRRAEFESGRLEIKGIAPVPNTVTVRYAGTQALISEVPVNDRRGRSLGIWRMSFSGFDITKIPCAITVKAGADTQEVAVENAPSTTCVGPPVGTPPPVSQPNNSPLGTIVAPAADATLVAGSAVTFTGTGSDPDNNIPLTFLWDFGGGAPNLTVDNAGAVIFAKAGTYTVKLVVTDSLGLADRNPPTRSIVVTAPVEPPPVVNKAPAGTLVSPAADVSIVAGETVLFSGLGTDADNNIPLSFAWDFSGGAPSATVQDPGAITFSVPGTYVVTLTVKDALGLADANPPKRTITVTAPLNKAPAGTLVSPAADASIVAGETVTFAGTGTDADNNQPLSFAWDFSGGAPSSTVQNPGAIAFSTPGTYVVTLTVKDALGLADANPPKRTITVTAPPVVPAQAPNATITAPATDVVVAAGTPVMFTATATDAAGLTVTYAWSFSGAAPNSTLESPGEITFSTPGVYLVTLTVTNSANLVDTTPAVRVVTVTAATASPVVLGRGLTGAEM